MNTIGSVKIVDGFMFTLVDKDGHSWMIEITKEGTDLAEIRIVGHNTWKVGKFVKILRELNPKPKKVKECKPRVPREPKPKTINGVVYRIIEKNKETKRVKVVAEGYEGVHEMSLSTWYRGKFTKNAMKHLVKKLMSYLPAKIIEKPISGDIINKHIENFKNILHYKEFKKAFTKLANIFHPDRGGNATLFQIIHRIYKVQGYVLKQCEELLMKQDYSKVDWTYDDIMKKRINLEWLKIKVDSFNC